MIKNNDCCRLKRKIALLPMSVPEEHCGVPDSEIADVLIFEHPETPNKRPVITFRFCPWCGKPWTLTGALYERERIQPDEESGEGWKKS